MEWNGTNDEEHKYTTGALLIDNSETVESFESFVNISECWFEANYGSALRVNYTQASPGAPTSATILNISNSKIFHHEYDDTTKDSHASGILINNAKRVNINNSYIVFGNQLSGKARTISINADMSAIFSTSVTAINDTSTYRTHFNVTDFTPKLTNPASNDDINNDGGPGFSEGVRIPKGKSLKFANGNPAIVNELAPHTDGGLKFNLSGGSVHSSSDFKAAGNLVSGAGVVDVNGERIERHSSGHGIHFNVSSGGNVTTNTNIVTPANIVTTWGEVKVITHTIKHDTSTGDMMLVPEAGHSLRCTSDVMAAGNLATPGAWNTGKLKLGTYSIWVDSTGHLRIKNGNPTSDTDGNLV